MLSKQSYQVPVIQVALKNVCLEHPWRAQLVSISAAKGSMFTIKTVTPLEYRAAALPII